MSAGPGNRSAVALAFDVDGVPAPPELQHESWSDASLPSHRPTRHANATGAAPAHVLISMPNGKAQSLPVVAKLDRATRITLLEKDVPPPALAPIDVAVVHSECMGLGTAPLLCDPDLGLPELVLVVDDLASPEHIALRSRGFQLVIAADDLPGWLPSNLPRLVALARARRTLLSACAEQPSAANAATSAIFRTRGMKLHAAETCFRRTFMRALLAEHGSRRRAAEEARVPYRSFCEMLRKLGL